MIDIDFNPHNDNVTVEGETILIQEKNFTTRSYEYASMTEIQDRGC